MKKLIVSILAALYLFATAGATIHLHYCMNELVSWTLSAKKENKCDNCGMEKEGGCCNDEQKLVKNNSDQKVTEPLIRVLSTSHVVRPGLVANTYELHSSILERDPTTHAPPGLSGADILIYNCIFRI